MAPHNIYPEPECKCRNVNISHPLSWRGHLFYSHANTSNSLCSCDILPNHANLIAVAESYPAPGYNHLISLHSSSLHSWSLTLLLVSLKAKHLLKKTSQISRSLSLVHFTSWSLIKNWSTENPAMRSLAKIVIFDEVLEWSWIIFLIGTFLVSMRFLILNEVFARDLDDWPINLTIWNYFSHSRFWW